MEVRNHQGIRYVFITGEKAAIANAQDALDLMVTAQYESMCDRIAVPKDMLAEDFFRLGSGLAGEILQKFVNYQVKLAIIGDFSGYQSKPLQDFITESNRGKQVFFVATQSEAAEMLCRP